MQTTTVQTARTQQYPRNKTYSQHPQPNNKQLKGKTTHATHTTKVEPQAQKTDKTN
jgi:hypothetical protein